MTDLPPGMPPLPPDDVIVAALEERGAAWLMDEADEYGQPRAIRAVALACARWAFEEAAKRCESNNRIISGSMGPLMDVGWGMAAEHCAKLIRAAIPQAGPREE